MDVFHGHHVNRVLNAGSNILRLKIRVIVLNDLREGKPFTDEFQHALYGIRVPDTQGFPK